jgi:hypothetical protein
MGYDSNIKSSRAEKRQRLTLIIAIVGLSLASIIAVNFLRRSRSTNAATTKNNVSQHLQLAIANKKQQQQQQQQGHDKVVISSDNNDNNKHLRTAIKNDITQLSDLEKETALEVSELELRVRSIKKTGIIMETDKESLALTSELQDATRALIKLRYGDFDPVKHPTPYRIKMDLEFQSTIPDFVEKGKDGTVVIELAPISLIPYSVYNFLEIARTWKKGAFHRNAGHVLQAIARSDVTQSMPFQEYSRKYPHKKYTVGYAGRPSGPEFYISIQDNTDAHGPGSQQKHNPYEADCIIGTVIQGVEDGTVARIHTMPGKEFLSDKNKWVWIRRMHILVPKDDGSSDEYVTFSSSPLVIPDD